MLFLFAKVQYLFHKTMLFYVKFQISRHFMELYSKNHATLWNYIPNITPIEVVELETQNILRLFFIPY